MLHGIRPRLSFANVVSVIALFIALGGSVYAATKINGKTIEKGSIPGNRLKPDKVTGKQVNESKLQLELDFACPTGTTALAGACIENSSRTPQSFFNASETCAAAGRRLPTASELLFLEDVLGAHVVQMSSSIIWDDPGDFRFVTVDETGVFDDEDTTGTPRAFRCVATPIPG
jgi:hypothetical protein